MGRFTEDADTKLAAAFRKERGRLTVTELARKYKVPAQTVARVVHVYEVTVCDYEDRLQQLAMEREAMREYIPHTRDGVRQDAALAAAKQQLRREIAAAKAELATAKPFKGVIRDGEYG